MKQAPKFLHALQCRVHFMIIMRPSSSPSPLPQQLAAFHHCNTPSSSVLARIRVSGTYQHKYINPSRTSALRHNLFFASRKAMSVSYPNKLLPAPYTERIIPDSQPQHIVVHELNV